MAAVKKLIQRIELSSAQASITFSNIPQDFTDLYCLLSGRTTRSSANGGFQIAVNFNGTTSNLSSRMLFGNGSSTGSLTDTKPFFYQNASDTTSNSYGNGLLYIPNYAGSAVKSFSIDSVYENNATTARQNIGAGLWNDTAAITSITFYSKDGDNIESLSSATLYGIRKGSDGTTAVS